MPNVHVHIHGSSTRDAVKHDPKTGQFAAGSGGGSGSKNKKVTGTVGGTRHIETKAGSGEYVPLGKYTVHKHGEEPSLKNVIAHYNSETTAAKHAKRLWEKTGHPHITKTAQYLRD